MKRRHIIGIMISAAMCMLILNTKTAVSGAAKGIAVCLETVMPSLFPFLILSKLFNDYFAGRRLRVLKPIARMCHIPKGIESILVLGFLGGYPVGAHAIGEMYKNKNLDKDTAHRLLGFCSNAGPSFIFGMAGFLFKSGLYGWCIWIIQILSAIIVGMILPYRQNITVHYNKKNRNSLVDSLQSSVRTMGNICGWVILFRVIIEYLYPLFDLFPNSIFKIILIGILEISNGCVFLNEISSQAIRFMAVNAILSFGGICVLMQTKSALNGLEIKNYVNGKLLQCNFSIILSSILQIFMFPTEKTLSLIQIGLISLFLATVHCILINQKKVVASLKKILYNQFKAERNEV